MSEINEARRRLGYAEDIPRHVKNMDNEHLRELTHETMKAFIDEFVEIQQKSEKDEVGWRLTALAWLAADIRDATEPLEDADD